MEGPIRILHVIGCLNRGGAETMTMNLYRNIDRSKVQFDFMVHTTKKCDYDDEIIKMGGKIYNVPRYSGKNHIKYKKAWYDFFKSHPEHKIIHGHIRSTASIYLKIAKKYGRISIAHSHSSASRGNKIEQIVKKSMQIPLRNIADYLFTCSNEAGKRLFGEEATKRSNYKIIKNAIDIKEYLFNESIRTKLRKELNIKDKFILGHVGSFTYPKNHKFLIEVFYEIQKKNKDAILLLIGEGDLKNQIKMQIESLDIEDKVIFTGTVSNVNDYMQIIDVFVFPSLFEGLPVTLIEAQASGLPCIVSDVITAEVAVTELINPISLNEPPLDWANEILRYKGSSSRSRTYDEIKCSGYDIEESVAWIETFYLNLYMKKGQSDLVDNNYTYL